jgi:hypothetical protein
MMKSGEDEDYGQGDGRSEGGMTQHPDGKARDTTDHVAGQRVDVESATEIREILRLPQRKNCGKL